MVVASANGPGRGGARILRAARRAIQPIAMQCTYHCHDDDACGATVNKPIRPTNRICSVGVAGRGVLYGASTRPDTAPLPAKKQWVGLQSQSCLKPKVAGIFQWLGAFYYLFDSARSLRFYF